MLIDFASWKSANYAIWRWWMEVGQRVVAGRSGEGGL